MYQFLWKYVCAYCAVTVHFSNAVICISGRYSDESIWRLCKVDARAWDRWRSKGILAVDRVSFCFTLWSVSVVNNYRI